MIKRYFSTLSRFLQNKIHITSVDFFLVKNAAFWGTAPLTYHDSMLLLLKSKWMVIRCYITLATLTVIRILFVLNIVIRIFQKNLDLTKYVDVAILIRVLILFLLGIFDVIPIFLLKDVVAFHNNTVRFYNTYLGK